MESRVCASSLMSLCAAVVCRQGGTHGTLMARRARRCMRFVEAEALSLSFFILSHFIYWCTFHPLYCLFFQQTKFSQSWATSWTNTNKTSTPPFLFLTQNTKWYCDFVLYYLQVTNITALISTTLLMSPVFNMILYLNDRCIWKDYYLQRLFKVTLCPNWHFLRLLLLLLLF